MGGLSSVSISITSAIVYGVFGAIFFLLIFLLVLLGVTDCNWDCNRFRHISTGREGGREEKQETFMSLGKVQTS